MQLNDVEKCYASALIEGIELIVEKAADLAIDPSLDADALLHFVRSRGDELIQIYGVNFPQQVDRKQRYGRKGLPEWLLEEMIESYRRTRSLAKTAKKFNRSRQSMHQILRGRVEMQPTYRNLHEVTVWNGLRFTPGKDGYLRLTTHGGRDSSGVLLHRRIWIVNHGPIPEGYLVIFRDGNKRNFDLSNLQLRKKADHLALFRKDHVDNLKLGRLGGIKASARLRAVWARYTPEEHAARVRKALRRRWPAQLEAAA